VCFHSLETKGLPTVGAPFSLSHPGVNRLISSLLYLTPFSHTQMDVQAADAGRREVAGEGHQRGGMSRREVTRTVRRRDGVGLPTKPTSAVARQAIQCGGVTMTIV
jgi:hypothetical protein